MKNIFYSDPEEIKEFLLGYKPKKFESIQEFYNYVGNFLLKKDPENPYILENINDWLEAKKNDSFEEDMLCEGFDLWYEFNHKDIVHLAQEHLGDGKPLEIVYALLDRKNREYTLVCLCGYYSSWADSEFDTCIPVELKEKQLVILRKYNMRLTKYMKENLYTIIKNQTKNPITEIEKKCVAELQDWVFNHCEPCVKEFHNLYGLYERHSICFYKHQYKTLTVIVPCYKWFTSNNNPKPLATNNYKSDRWEEVEKTHPDLAKICDKYQEGLKLEQEYLEHLKNVKEIIFNCNTDKQLSEVFPEFVQFFNKAGIVHYAKPSLPAKLGLPEALCKYGFKLETVESVEEQIREETNADK